MVFPKKIAQDTAFCNRVLERQRLKHNIENCEHTLIISPRRYGKTSLALKVLADCQYPYAYIDWFLAIDEETIQNRFLAGISIAISQLMPINEKAIKIIKSFFTSFNLSLSYADVAAELKFSPDKNQSLSDVLRRGIEGFESLLIKQNKKGIIFIDEFQEVVETPYRDQIEATIRFFAQKTQNIAFIFSGSNRRLLGQIFDDRSRPLYKLCDRVHLGRIHAEDYIPFIQEAAQKRWNTKLPDAALEKILLLTEQHSYYINALCSELWKQECPPTYESVITRWKNLCQEEEASVANDINALTLNQKKIAQFVAAHANAKSLTSSETLSQLKLTHRGMTQSLKGLLQNDVIEEIDSGYRIVDPVIKHLLMM